MREILFRGKCKDTGKWYTGNYIHLHKTTYCFKEDYDHFKDNDIHQIVFEKMTDWGLPNQHLRVDVIPETIGQYTGLTDKNGTKIFEGDILKFAYNEEDKEPIFYSIEWKKDRACFGYAETADKMIEVDLLHCEVIGNIHDNPELLKELG